MALKRLCPKCKHLIENTEKYCKKCAEEYKQDKRKDYIEYNNTKRDKKSSKFYSSREWKLVRDIVRERDNNLCRVCLSNKMVKGADMVHHIEELQDNYNRRVDTSNLVSLCSTCHNHTHALYSASYKDKTSMQDRLFKLAKVGGME